MNTTNQNDLVTAASDGIYRTLNGGTTWTQIVTGANVNDMEYKPNDPNTLYFTALGVDSLYIMDMTTLTFTTTIINATTASDRMTIGVTADNPNAVYLYTGLGMSPAGGIIYLMACFIPVTAALPLS